MSSHEERAIRMARRPYDILTTVTQCTHPTSGPYNILTAVAQQMHPMYGQTSLQCTDCSRTTHASYIRPDVPTTY